MKKMPMSAVVRRIIAELPFTEESRAIVHDLLWLEEVVAGGGPSGFAAGMHFSRLKARWPRACEEIMRELHPKLFAKELRERELEERRERRRAVEEAARARRLFERDREMWARCKVGSEPGGG